MTPITNEQATGLACPVSNLSRCLGSLCMAWTPQVRKTFGRVKVDGGGSVMTLLREEPTGLGVCAMVPHVETTTTTEV